MLVALCVSAALSISTMTGATPQDDEPAHGVRAPLPSPEEIAALPADGGDEFNRLVFSGSPYLLQHARNPVDWHEWGPAAFELAAERGVPVFLSIGYSTCHWCHVMEHESFEDAEVARLMNEAFVCVKLDREERPDIDQLYMSVTQALTGSGGWPMTVVMTPDKRPFFAGTYFPKQSIGQRFGMLELVPALSSAWSERREEVLQSAAAITEDLAARVAGAPGENLTAEHLAEGEAELSRRFDSARGGFGAARKFPVPHEQTFLLRRHGATGSARALEMVERTLGAWRLGGVFDQVGLGIHRYSTDPNWLVPHFEKMLYDQALCCLAYVDAWLVTGDASYERAAREILAYVSRDMTSPEGGFYSAEDADSEGEEGLFYLWTEAELGDVLDAEEAAFVRERLGTREEGNYRDESTGERTGRNVLHLKAPLSDAELARWEPLRLRLFESREGRIHPLKDDKVLTDWNGLMISAFARAGRAFGDEALVATARRAAGFVLSELRTDSGRLLKRWRGGEAGLHGMLEDHAFLAQGLLDLFEASHEVLYLVAAREIVDTAVLHFHDGEAGGFFLSPDDGEALLVRSKTIYDGARPSGNSVMACVLQRLSRMTGETGYEELAAGTIRAFSAQVEQSPSYSTQLLAAVDFQTSTTREIVIVGRPEAPETQAMLALLAGRYAPNDVVLLRPPGEEGSALAAASPFTGPLVQVDGTTTAYVCSDFTCAAPVTTLAALAGLLADRPGDR
jgi:uncharacterized protein